MGKKTNDKDSPEAAGAVVATMPERDRRGDAPSEGRSPKAKTLSLESVVKACWEALKTTDALGLTDPEWPQHVEYDPKLLAPLRECDPPATIEDRLRDQLGLLPADLAVQVPGWSPKPEGFGGDLKLPAASREWLYRFSRQLRVPKSTVFPSSNRRELELAHYLLCQAAMRQSPEAILDLMVGIDRLLETHGPDEEWQSWLSTWALHLPTRTSMGKQAALDRCRVECLLVLVKNLPAEQRKHWTNLITFEQKRLGLTSSPRGAALQDGTLTHVFIKGDIEPARERDEADSLARYSVLKSPLPLVLAPDLEKVRSELLTEMPHAKEVIEKLLAWIRIRAQARGGAISFPPVLLHGPTGCGKDYLLTRLAELLGLPFQLHNIGGTADNRLLEGTARGWGSSRPSLPCAVIARTRVANPLLIFDEIDKFEGGGHNGNPLHTLLQLLEPQNAKCWHDPFLVSDVDLRPLNYAATANEIRWIPAPLLNRFRVLNMRQPETDEYYQVVHSTINSYARDLGVGRYQIPDFGEAEWAYVENVIKVRPSVRRLTTVVRQILDYLSRTSAAKALH